MCDGKTAQKQAERGGFTMLRLVQGLNPITLTHLYSSFFSSLQVQFATAKGPSCYDSESTYWAVLEGVKGKPCSRAIEKKSASQ